MKLIKTVCCILLLLVSTVINAQVDAQNTNSFHSISHDPLRQFSRYYGGLNYSYKYEHGVGSKTAAQFEFAQYSNLFNLHGFGTSSVPFTVYYTKVGLGYYYFWNIKKRRELGKDVTNNAANYFGVKSENYRFFKNSSFSNYSGMRRLYFSLLPYIGFRRNFTERLFFNLSGGYGLVLIRGKFVYDGNTDVGYSTGPIISMSFELGLRIGKIRN